MRLASYHSDYFTTIYDGDEGSSVTSKYQHLAHLLSSPTEQDSKDSLPRLSPYLSTGLDFQSNKALSTSLNRPLSVTGLGIQIDSSRGPRSTITCDLNGSGDKFIRNSPLPFTLATNSLFDDDFGEFHDFQASIYSPIEDKSFFCQSHIMDQGTYEGLYDTPRVRHIEYSKSTIAFDSPDFDAFSSGSQMSHMPNFIVDINMFDNLQRADEQSVKPADVLHESANLLDEFISSHNGNISPKPRDEPSLTYDSENTSFLTRGSKDNDILTSQKDILKSTKAPQFYKYEQDQQVTVSSNSDISYSVCKEELNLQPEVTLIFESMLSDALSQVNENLSQISSNSDTFHNIGRTLYIHGEKHNLGKRDMNKPGYKNSIASKIFSFMQSGDSSIVQDFPIVNPHRGIEEDLVARKVASFKLMHPGEKLPDTLLFCFAGKQVQCKPAASVYVCYILDCGKTTKRKDHMADHIRTHLGEKPFQCRTW